MAELGKVVYRKRLSLNNGRATIPSAIREIIGVGADGEVELVVRPDRTVEIRDVTDGGS